MPKIRIEKHEVEAARVLLELLEKLQAEVRDGLLWSHWMGICGNIAVEVRHPDIKFILGIYFAAWPGCAQDRDFPVEGSHRGYRAQLNKWDPATLHGRRRRELLDFCVAELKASLEAHSEVSA